MNKLTKFVGVITTLVITPVNIALAQPGVGGGGGDGGAALENPLSNTTITGLLLDILDVIMIFAIPLIVFMIIYAGFLYVTAQGNEGKIEQARKALTYAIIGGVIILMADIILEVIQGTVDAL